MKMNNSNNKYLSMMKMKLEGLLMQDTGIPNLCKN